MKNLCLITMSMLSIINTASAQKLPVKQTISLKAPANVNIDGKMTEWGATLQAYNKSTLIYYTIANDADNLYLAIRIEDPNIINKAISGAITLTINPTGKQSDVRCPTVSFPLLNSSSGSAIRNNAGLLSGIAKRMQEASEEIATGSKPNNGNGSDDSLLLVANNRLRDDAKEIKLSDVDGITDTVTGTHIDKLKQFRYYPLFVLPGYYIKTVNNYGIKAAATFEGHLKYTYELAVPLKLLKVEPGKKFSYNIRLNGPMYKTNKPTSGYAVHFRMINGHAEKMDQDLTEATDFWGEYVLVN